jgi:integrase
LAPEEVEKLLQSCDRNTPAGRRDYAILLLLARLGLRGGEVAHMVLEDIDWAAGELVVRGKSKRRSKSEAGGALKVKHQPPGLCDVLGSMSSSRSHPR